MKLILVDNLIMPAEGSLAVMDVHPHLGLLALAAAAEGAGHRVSVYDPKRLIRSGALAYDSGLYETTASHLLAGDPDAVGFTALGCSFLFALRVAESLKRSRPELPILLGGPHATMLHRQVLERFSPFDVVVRHEADETLPRVLSALPDGRFHDIPGISWRARRGDRRIEFTEGRPKVADLDTLPIASYDYYPVRSLGLDLLRLEAGRGCPFECTFCSTAGFFQRSFRLKSAPRLVREMDILHGAYGHLDFKLDHDMFTVNRRKVVEFCEAVRGRGYRWRVSARVDCVDAELLARMAEAGCVGLYFGIETGSARMQHLCGKRLDLGLVRPMLAEAERLGIETTASFITGFPEEEKADQDETLDMAGRCFTPSCLVQLHPLAPEPGTPMFERHGASVAYDGYGSPYNAEFAGPADESTVRDNPDVFQTYFHYPAALPRERHIFVVEAVAALRRLGPVLLGYLLRAYGGRLSVLIEDWLHRCDVPPRDVRPDGALLEAYVRSRFGADHHVTSLVRFALRLLAPEMTQAPPRPVIAAGDDSAGRYALSPDAEFLEDIHDCAALLERIRVEPEGRPCLEPWEAGSLGVHVLLRRPGQTRADVYWMDPGAHALLALFAPPARISDVRRIVAAATGRLPDGRFFEELIASGVLIGATGAKTSVHSLDARCTVGSPAH